MFAIQQNNVKRNIFFILCLDTYPAVTVYSICMVSLVDVLHDYWHVGNVTRATLTRVALVV